MNKPQFINELNIPAVAAPMFLISGPEIVIECCKKWNCWYFSSS